MLKTGIRAWSKPGGNRIASSSCGRPSTRAGAPPVSLPLATTSTVSGVPARTCMPTIDGIEARAEVVDVRDDDRAHAAPHELGERAGRADRRQQVAVARPVERRLPVGADEQAAVGPQARRRRLAEPERLARAPARRRAPARPRRSRSSSSARPGSRCRAPRPSRSRLAELDLEEAAAVDRLRDGLDARRRSGSPCPRRARPWRSPPRASASVPAATASSKPGSPGAGSGGQVGGKRRLDDARDDVPGRRPRAVGELRPGAARSARRRTRSARESRAPPGSTSSRIIASAPEREASRRTGRDGRPPRSRSPRSGRRA